MTGTETIAPGTSAEREGLAEARDAVVQLLNRITLALDEDRDDAGGVAAAVEDAARDGLLDPAAADGLGAALVQLLRTTGDPRAAGLDADLAMHRRLRPEPLPADPEEN
jgi:hypothetical protein